MDVTFQRAFPALPRPRNRGSLPPSRAGRAGGRRRSGIRREDVDLLASGVAERPPPRPERVGSPKLEQCRRSPGVSDSTRLPLSTSSRGRRHARAYRRRSAHRVPIFAVALPTEPDRGGPSDRTPRRSRFAVRRPIGRLPWRRGPHRRIDTTHAWLKAAIRRDHPVATEALSQTVDHLGNRMADASCCQTAEERYEPPVTNDAPQVVGGDPDLVAGDFDCETEAS